MTTEKNDVQVTEDPVLAALEPTQGKEESLDDRIRRVIAEDLAVTLPDDKLTPVQHYVRQHASQVVSVLVGNDDFLTYVSRNLQGIQIRAINRLLTESNARAPVPVVVESFVPNSIRLMVREVRTEDSHRRLDLDSAEVFNTDTNEFVPMSLTDEQRTSITSIVASAGVELGVYQYLTSDIDLEKHQRTVVDMFNGGDAAAE